MLILGIDDAGRGPLIGPMILAGVLIEKSQEAKLKELGAKDSKMLIHSTRVSLAKTIKSMSKYSIVKSTAEEIDSSLASGTNLNTLEAIKTAKIINELNNGEKIEVIVDCPSVNTLAWSNTVLSHIKNPENLILKCEHKADANHPVVSAASILAKVTREEQVSKLKKEFGDFGSGYPSDPKTKEFLKEKGQEFKDSGLFRKSWNTWKKMYPESDKKQKTLF